MSAGTIVALFLVMAYWSVACATAGYLFAKEPFEEKGPAWWFSLVAAALGWPFVLTLWRSSRPVPPQPPDDVDDRYLGTVSNGVYIHPTEIPPLGVHMVDRPASLALCGQIQVGERVWVKSLGMMFIRGQMMWFGGCRCRYNFSGFPVVLCRQHRSDVDPQGEPDESEGEVGL